MWKAQYINEEKKESISHKCPKAVAAQTSHTKHTHTHTGAGIYCKYQRVYTGQINLTTDWATEMFLTNTRTYTFKQTHTQLVGALTLLPDWWVSPGRA